MTSHRMKPVRQTSVLHELQETQEKDNLDSRYARLLSELSALCSDRSNVITVESLAYLAASGRAEPVKLEREVEQAVDQKISSSSGNGSSKQDMLTADAARRQRVEELTRFFMEAKSDIEFALGGNRESRESKDKDKDGDHDREEDRENETGDDEEEDKTEETADPVRDLARLHARLLKEKVDPRVYTGMLSQIREKDPALYGAALCHPLITGIDPRKDKKKKKKRKDRDRQKDKSQQQISAASTMFTPDFSAEPLTDEEMTTNISRFVAKAIADGSLQGLMLATKLVLAWVINESEDTAKQAPSLFPLVSHLRVLRGEAPPVYLPVRKETDQHGKQSASAVEQQQSGREASVCTEGERESNDFKSTGSELSAVDIYAESGSLAKLRARLSRFGDDGDDQDDDEDDDHGEDAGSIGEEGVDEDALMARAIALSLSPDMMKEQSVNTASADTAIVTAPLSDEEANAQEADTVKPRPAAFSEEEMMELSPFALPAHEQFSVDGSTVAMCLILQMSKICLKYIESCQNGVLPNNSPVQPHPLTFILINSVLSDLSVHDSQHSLWTQNHSLLAKWKLFASCSLLSMFRVLEAHLFHVEVMGIAPASVGLGQIPNSDVVGGGNNPLLESLKSLLVKYAEESVVAKWKKKDQSSNPVNKVIFTRVADCISSDIEEVADFYYARIREQATATWARGIAHFYYTQHDRYKLLVTKLGECIKLVGRANERESWKFHQLDLLCARLALPDLAQSFVPSCSNLVDENNDSDKKLSDSISVKTIDDGTLQNAASKTGKTQAKWTPSIIRASLAAGSLSTRCLFDYLVEQAPPGLIESSGLSVASLTDGGRDAETLSGIYEQMWDIGRQWELQALECINRLPKLIDMLRQSILLNDWLSFSFKNDYELPHAPLLPILEKKNANTTSLNTRVLLLRSLQDLMIQRLSGARGDEPPALDFDPSRCAETMTLSDNNQTAKQYTAKQWGMVMATTGCPPNTGIHEWAVRLDRCEKGHIFLGVCTRDASVATYVGGDRQGWGLIGTRALWHNRSKIRGDYGDGFSTGSTVRVRLNTDSGALSFGVDDNDWGIAFDGLTQHGTLYPAIGLYQRDDQVTILPVQLSDDSSSAGLRTGNARGLKNVAVPAVLKPFLHHAGTLLESCCSYLMENPVLSMRHVQDSSLSHQQKAAQIKDAVASLPLLFPLVTPLLSSLSLIRNYHGLASTLAMQFIPWSIKIMQCVENVNQALRLCPESEIDNQSGELAIDIGGEWELKSMASGNIPAQQYHLTITQGKDGTVQGRSSGSFTTVTLNGIVRGTKVCFVETWRQGGTCLVEGRLRADGNVFNGSYEDAKSHTSGHIVGNKIKSGQIDADSNCRASNQLMNDNGLVILEMVIANLVGFFAHSLINVDRDELLVGHWNAVSHSTDEEIVTEATTDGIVEHDDASKSVEALPSSSESTNEEYDEWVNSQLLSGGIPLPTVQAHLNSVLAHLSEVTGLNDIQLTAASPILSNACKSWLQFVMPKTLSAPCAATSGPPDSFLHDLIDLKGEAIIIDSWVSRHVGESPFARLGGEPMKVARRTICAAMIWHSGFLGSIRKILDAPNVSVLVNSEVRPHENLMHIWRAAQRVIEWAIRAKNSMGSTYPVVAGLVIRKAQFLLEIEPSAKAVAAASAVVALSAADLPGSNNSGVMLIPAKAAVYECAERIYSEVLMQISQFLEAPIRISKLQARILENATRSFFRTVGFLSFRSFVGESGNVTNRSVLSSEPHEVIQSSFALSSALQWLSPSLMEHGVSYSSLNKDVTDNGDLASLSSSPTFSLSAGSSHYLSGLGGCGKHLKADLRESFESVYGYLCASLSRATWARDVDLQLVILQAWGIIIQPDDHAFLSRVGIFRVLQTVLDETRGSPDVHFSTEGSNRATSYERNMIESKKKIIQATLKVVHLLAAQVAHAGDTADGLLGASELPAIPGLALGSIPLLRKPSGPETLGKSVFNMLYTELKNALQELRSSGSSDIVDNGAGVQFGREPTEVADPSSSFGEDHDDEMSDASEYCYQICSLLYSVSGSPVCRSHLSSSRWLRLLLALVDVNAPFIQRRILKLLRRLLPSLDPASIRVRYDQMESFDMDSDDDVDTDDTESTDHASTLVNFFVGIVGTMCPPSVAEIMLRRQGGHGERDQGLTGLPYSANSNAVGLAADLILLLRSLYESPKWAEYLNRAIVDALSAIPATCVTEADAEMVTSADSDVEMEDLSCELPSIDVWKTQTTNYLNALSALCVLDGHIEGIHVGGTVKIMPRSGSSLQEIAFRGARGVIVSYEPEKSAAEVLLRGSRSGDNQANHQTLTQGNILPTRPVRVPIDDLFAVPEVELDTSVFSDSVLQSLLVDKFSFFLNEVTKSLVEIQSVEAGTIDDSADAPLEDSEDEDEMSNDGSALSPSGMDSEMKIPSGSGGGEDSEAESEIESPRYDSRLPSTATKATEPTNIVSEMEKESRLYRMLLCQHGLRASATFLKDRHCAATFIRGIGAAGLINLLSVANSEMPTAAGVGDISSLEEKWLVLWSRWYDIRTAYATPAPKPRSDTKNDKKTGDSQTDNLAPGPMVQQMMEMGFPKEWCEVALMRCSQNVEAAINFCFEHSSDMDLLLAQHKASKDGSATDGSTTRAHQRKDEFDAISPLLEQLSEMGFPVNWCKKALAANRNNVDAALTWILSNGEALEAEDRREEEAKLSTDSDGKENSSAMLTDTEAIPKPNPLRVVSGQASIGEHDMMVEGLVGGGFASVGAPDCLVSSGRWYYEAVLLTNGCIQIGWADVAFCGAADRGDGVGDGAHSWAYDGWRKQKWHGQSSSWGSQWKQGDVVGCGIDADAGTIIFSLNGKMRSANMGVAFRAIDFARGVYPCASFNRRERLQFNLGGSSFKYPPPPGFQPIINVLEEGIRDNALVEPKKGFEVIGSREDCLEESMGEENYGSDARYFSRDTHPSMLRGSGSHGRSNGLASAAGGIKVEALSELKTIPDDRVYIELLLCTRSLSILQARRALLTLLTKWPAEDVGLFSVQTFLSSNMSNADQATVAATGDSGRFIDFIKLTAGLSGHNSSNWGQTAPTNLAEGEISHLLDCGATGRYALSMLSGVARSALHSSLSTITSHTTQGYMDARGSLVDLILSCILSEVKRASQRQYARIPWDSSDVTITASFVQLTAETGQPWSDKEVLNHPNLFLAEWLSGLLIDALSQHKNTLPRAIHDQVRQRLLQAWITSLKSPSLCVKERGTIILAGIFQDMLPKTRSACKSADIEERTMLENALEALPLRRLLSLSEDRLLKEYLHLPICSKYLQSLTELVSAAALAMNAVGRSTDELYQSNVSSQLAACKRIQQDLYPIDLREYEEAVAMKKQLLAEQEAEQELKRQKAEETASTGDERETRDNDEEEKEGTDNASAENNNMEIDNSDSEEAPDITLSAIANMVAEDSDVVAAAAAIAAAASSRLSGKRLSKTKPASESMKKDVEFEFLFPDQEIAQDTSMLNDDEQLRLEAAKYGIMRDESCDWQYGHEVGVLSDTETQLWSGSITQYRLRSSTEEHIDSELKVGCKVIRGPNWKWRDQDGGEGSIGVVEGVSPWSGVDGEGMSVRWPNDSLYTYRWGADGNFDLVHVEVDEEGKIVHHHPTPKTKQDDEGSFGSELHLGVLIHLFSDTKSEKSNSQEMKVNGTMEWPDYGAEISIVGLKYPDGTLCIQELQMLRGNPDMGWTLRFGTEKWQPGTKYLLRPLNSAISSDDNDAAELDTTVLRGEYSHGGIKNGSLVEVRGEIQVTTKYLFTMDPFNHFPTLSISDEGMSVTCTSGESRNLALGTVGFTTGIHYWEVRVDQAEYGSVFIGVCEKAGPPGSQAALASRLNRWHGWGFVNFRATYHNSTERIYGDHFNAGDTIGVRLDMEQGKLSFFMDGIKFGEHIVADLGVAFDNMKGDRNSRTLYPCIGMRKSGDRVTLNEKWISMPGISPRQILKAEMDVSKCLHAWYVSMHEENRAGLNRIDLPESLLKESWLEWRRWAENRWQRYPVRPRGLFVDFDTSPSSCIAVSEAAGLVAPFLAGDRVRMVSKCGRELNQPEEAVILGVYREFLWFRTETQGNEGADEGRSWAWYLAPSELVELVLIRRNGKDMTLIENSAMDLSGFEDDVTYKPQPGNETQALTDFAAFVSLATHSHSAKSDIQLVERLNLYCASIGVDITNLKITDVTTPQETDATSENTRPRAHSLVPDDYFSSPDLKDISGPELRARCAVLRVLNSKILCVLPMIRIQSSESSMNVIEVSSVFPSSAPTERNQNRLEYLSTSHKLRALRRLIFTSTKRAFWDDVLRATTTSTPLPSDEYEDPREIRVIRINRIQAQASKLSLLAQPGDRLRRSVFGQLYREMRTWNDSFFRRAYCGKGHGGQRRAFKVKFLGEGVNDYGGPYRAVFEQVVDELQMDNVELSKGEQGLLPLLIPCPNRRSGTGSNQDKFLLNPSCGTSLLSNGPIALELHRFLGKIIGTAVRHGLQMGLDLPALVWRPLAGLDVTRAHLESVDVVTANHLSRVEECTDEGQAADLLDYLSFTTTLSDGAEVPLCQNGDKSKVEVANRMSYVELVEKMRLTESSHQLAALKDGLASVLPMELAPLFTPRELEVLICGRREVDVDLLRQCTEYSDGADESMPHVQWFWDVLHEMSSDERTSFLRFVWARSRMPNSAKDFPMNFKIQSAHDPGARVDPDKYLPHAQTCFFALRLPSYTSKEIARAKLLYAIQNSPNMDADVRLHNAEGWADA